MRTTLPALDSDESVIVEFDFTGELTPATAVVTATTLNGVDPDVATVLVGVAQIVGASVFHRVKPNLVGVNYKLRCKATQGDDVRVRVGILPTREA
jgi:hypothetical protein